MTRGVLGQIVTLANSLCNKGKSVDAESVDYPAANALVGFSLIM
jgi:hypothetical protein